MIPNHYTLHVSVAYLLVYVSKQRWWWLGSGDGGGGQVVGDVCVGLGRLLDELGELLHELGDGEILGA